MLMLVQVRLLTKIIYIEQVFYVLYIYWQIYLIRYYLDDAELLDVENMRLYKYRDLQIATEDFKPENKIGQGGFGSVYKVIF